jgi:hypothetical protein
MVNNSTNINKTNNHLSPSSLNIDGQQCHHTNHHLSPSSLNSDGQQFHQYLVNNSTNIWSTIPPISTKQTTTSHLQV